MRIVCFGDSLTWGGYGGSYVHELAHLLPEHRFINSGVSGDTIHNLLERVDRDVITHAPSAVLIMVGCNDAIAATYPGTRRYYQQIKGLKGGYLKPDAFEQKYRDLLTRVRLAGIRPYVALQPSEYTPALNEMVAVMNARARRATLEQYAPILDLPAHLGSGGSIERPPLTLEMIDSVGRRIRAGWNDYESERARGGYTFTFDGLHLTPEGARRIAGLMAAFIGS
jgi:lysophospholipase L1-like esterase